MKVGSKELFEVVRQVVRDEVKKVLPEMVAKHLTEQYIRKALAEQVNVVSERVVSKPSQRILPRQEYKLPANIRELVSGEDEMEEEPIPEPMSNDHQGIYEPANPLIKKNESVAAKLLARANPALAHIYEGMTPIEPEGSTAGAPDVPLQAVAQATGMDFSKMNAMIEGLERGARSKGAMQTSVEAQERELERKRKELDRPVAARPKVL